MNIILFGASRMVGQGVLRECIADPGVDRIVVVTRKASGLTGGKVEELVHADLLHFEAVEPALTGFDACFFTLGVSASTVKPEEYERITYGMTIAAAETLVRLNPDMVFIYVSGASTDSTEKGRARWARVKGRTENALLRLPFRAAYMLRPGLIQPMDGIQSRTASYRALYGLLKPVLPLLRRLLPNFVINTRELGLLMLLLVREPFPKAVLETADMRAALLKGLKSH